MKQEALAMQRELDGRDQLFVDVGSEGSMPSDAALGALLEDGSPAADAEGRVRRLAERLARLDALNVAGMLAAASEGDGAGVRLATRLDAGLAAGAGLAARLRRCEAVVRAAPDAAHARFGAARTDANARALLAELEELYSWLDAPPLRDLDSISEISLASAEGRARALAAGAALQGALRAERAAGARRLARLGAVRERLRRLARAREALAAALARHLNNALIHLGNEAAHEPRPRKHHADLLPYAPFMRWLKDMDERAFDGLAKVYTSTWAKVYERAVGAASEQARAALVGAAPERADPILDGVLTLVESLCDAEQDFCTQFFYLDVDVKRGDARAGGVRAARGGGRGGRGAVGARGAGGRRGGGQAAGGPRRGRAPGRAARRRQAGGPPAQVRPAVVPEGFRGAERRLRGDILGRAARGPGPLVRVAGGRHAARHPARRAPAHAARRAAHGELPPAARHPVAAARGGAGVAAAREPRALLGRAQGLRHTVLRPPAREAHAVLRGRGGGGGGRRARGRGVLPRRLQQARAAPPAGHVPRARSAQVAAPAVPHGGEAPERGGRAAAGGVARHAGGVPRAAPRAAVSHRHVLRGRGAGHAADDAGHPGRLLRHRARALSRATARPERSASPDVCRRPVLNSITKGTCESKIGNIYITATLRETRESSARFECIYVLLVEKI